MAKRERITHADYVVVGAGSAGCVVAARLSAAGHSVILLEAGPRDRNIMIHIPAGLIRLRGNKTIDWKFSTVPQVHAGNRRIQWPRGRVLGGSSSINGMNHVRGLPSDFDEWAELGCDGWSYEDVLPYFRKSETYTGGEDRFHGRHGPVQVEDYRTILPLTHKFVRAAGQAGHEVMDDLNGRTVEGVGYSQMARKGRFRSSSARAYLTDPAVRNRLRVMTDTLVTGLAFEGRRCVGVDGNRGGHRVRIAARHEVIVSCGAIGSPQLLQVSGVGDPGHLRSIGTEVVHALPAVGQNLRDHYAASVTYRVKDALTVNETAHGWRLVLGMLDYVFRARGPLTFGATTASLFVRSQPDNRVPDLQILFMPGSLHQRSGDLRKQLGQLEDEPGMRVSVSCAKPQSHGAIRASSSDITVPPDIDPNYLANSDDLATVTNGIAIARKVFEQPELSQHVRHETVPGIAPEDRAALEDYVRNTGYSTAHPAGSCRMGADDASVVDTRLRVRGIDGLRVVDASIMPTVPTGNINAPTVMIGEKGAAMILEDL